MREENFVSSCCHKPIFVAHGMEYPLGGKTWGISYKYDACSGCGKETDPVEACEECGVVGCSGICEDEPYRVAFQNRIKGVITT